MSLIFCKLVFYSTVISYVLLEAISRELLEREAHSGALGGHSGVNKTIEILKEHFYWTGMTSDVHNIVFKYAICHGAESIFPPRVILSSSNTK